MELPVLDKFCFVFNLKTGCLIMGIFNSISTLFLAVVLITFAVDIKPELVVAEKTRREEREDLGLTSVVYSIVIFQVVLLLVKFLVDLVFVYGCYRNNCKIMKKYCIFWVVFLVIFILGFLKTLFHMVAAYVIMQILFLAMNIYFIMTIRSYLIAIEE